MQVALARIGGNPVIRYSLTLGGRRPGSAGCGCGHRPPLRREQTDRVRLSLCAPSRSRIESLTGSRLKTRPRPGDSDHGCFDPHQVREPSLPPTPTRLSWETRHVNTSRRCQRPEGQPSKLCRGCCGADFTTVNAISAGGPVPSDQRNHGSPATYFRKLANRPSMCGRVWGG
jgi:hypothetical protein